MSIREHAGRALLGILVVFQVAMAEEPIGSSDVDWPQTRAAQMAAAFIEAFHAADEEAMRRFTLENRDAASLERLPIEQRMAQFKQMRQQLGELQVASVVSDEDLKAEVIVRSSGLGLWMAMSFELQAEAPHKLAHFGMRPSAPPEQSNDTFADWKSLQELADRACEESGIPAIAIAVVRDGEIQERAIAGVRQSGTADVARLEDCFQMGSIGKSITATWIATLIDAGRLDWDTTVGEILAEIDVRRPYRAVTLEQLLHHRSGLPPYADERLAEFPDLAKPGRSATEERVLFARRVLQDEPVTEPGVFSYSNAGYAIAVVMAERASGMSYEESMRRALFAPLQMGAAYFGWPASTQRPDQPRGHLGSPPDLQVQGLDEDPWQSYMLPAGGISCPIEDLSRYALFHLRGLAGEDGLLQASSVQRLHLEMHEDSGARGYAAGWVIEKTAFGEPKHSHSGSAGSFYAHLSLYPESNLAIALAANCAGTAGAVIEELAQRIYERSTQASRAGR